MKEINNKGKFTTKHEGVEIQVLFFEDYARLHNLSKYELQKAVKKFQVHRLDISGRKRMKSVIVDEYKEFKLFKTSIFSRPDGSFLIKVKNKFVRVMFTNQYAEREGKSKEMIEHDMMKLGKTKYVKLERFNGKSINLVIL